jgi:hypothetical protein
MYEGRSAENPDIPAGYTYFGQLITHDITFDARSSLQEKNDPERLRNYRTPRFDLDCVYGRGPEDQPYLYSQREPGKLLLGTNHPGELDLPRNRDTSSDSYGTRNIDRLRSAVIGDARNDETVLLSQLQLGFIRFHNRRIDDGKSFDDARRLTRWHYQWVVIHDFLKRLCGADLVNALLEDYGRRTLRVHDFKTQPFLPVEFSMAAFRMGHSMVRSQYRLSDALNHERNGVPLAILGSGTPEHSLEGGRELPPRWTVQWDLFVSSDGSQPQPSMLIDPYLAPALRLLPLEDPDPRFRSLAFRTLLRGWRTGLPSGQSVAQRMGESQLPDDDPLWFYILKEAAERGAGGRRLGPVGARIVAEVVTGLLAADNESYYSVNPNWTPELPARQGPFTLRDFLAHAGAPITAADWAGRPGS